MKKNKLFGFMCVIFIGVLLCISIMADEGTRLHLEEVGISITIPSEYEIFMPGVSSDDPRFEQMGIDGEHMVELLNSGFYLSAVARDFSAEITVSMTPNSFYKDYNLLGANAVRTWVESFARDMFETVDAELIDYSIFQHEQALFVEYHVKNLSNLASAIQYSTIYDSKNVNITYWFYDGDITQADRVLVKSVVDEVVFDTEPQKPNPVSETKAFVYTDSATGTSFTVPDGWKERELSQEREFIDAAFASTQDETVTILYGSTDLWSRATDEMRQGLSRSDITISALTKEDIAAICGASSTDVLSVKYNGIQYYQTNVTSTHNLYGIDWSVKVTCLTYIDNGWLYQFQFGGTEESEFYSDFISLMNSVRFPTRTPASTTEVTYSTGNTLPESSFTSTQSNLYTFDIGSIVLSLIITIAVYSAPIFIYRYAIRRRPMDRKPAKILTVLYAVFGFIIMSLIMFTVNHSAASGGGVLLWSFVNYKVLIGGSDKIGFLQKNPSYANTESGADIAPQTQKSEEAISPKVTRCRYCGAQLPEGNAYCHKCGAKVEGE